MQTPHPLDLPVTFGRDPAGSFTLESAVWVPRPVEEVFKEVLREEMTR